MSKRYLPALAIATALSAACSSDKPEAPPADNGPPILGTGADGAIFNPGEGGQGASSSGGPLGPDESCVGQEAGTEAAPATMLLLVDTSLSMDERAPGSNNQSKWVVTRRAVLQAVEDMPATSSIGVVFYPDVGVGDMPCFDSDIDVDISLLGATNSQQRRRIESQFTSQSPDGSTPTHDAYRYALQQVESANAPGPRFVALITDGTPTYSLGCVGSGQQDNPSDPTPLIPEAASAFGRGLKTFVIGSPGSEGARASLSRMAQAGGTAPATCSHDGPEYCHFDMTEERDFSAALTDALTDIAGLALSCSYDVPPPPSGDTLDPARVNVIFTPGDGEAEYLLQNTSADCSEGWRYSNNQRQVLLCRDTCDRVESSADGRLSLEFGCTTRVIF